MASIEQIDSSAPLNYVFLVYTLFALIIFTYKGFSLGKGFPHNRIRLHTFVVTVPIIMIGIAAMLIHMLLPMLGLSDLPPFIQIPAGIWIALFSLLLIRYAIFSASPAAASDQIVYAMSDFCIIIDREGMIFLFH
ncbi:MAG: hypothetical protein SNJ56_04340 [Termitinemataceae bacterium]